jgi:hypothetical protein
VATVSDCILPFFGESLMGVALPTHGATHDHADGHHHDAETETGVHEHTVEPNAENHGAHEHVEAVASHEDHADLHAEPASERPSIRQRLHLGFIEDWYIVNPAAILGIIIAYFWPRTKFPHAGHVLISTWASSFHVLMNTQRELTPGMFVGIFVVLFIAVWLPCCVSDIVFPLLFVKSAPRCTHHPERTEVIS